MHNTSNPLFSHRKKIFITGIAGFIGFHLALQLKKEGHDVIGCDNFNSYYDPQLKKDRTAILSDHHIPVLPIALSERAKIEKEIQENSITTLIHLAAQAGVRHSLTHPESYVHSNLDGFVEILEICKHHPHLKLIFASSSSVYGQNQKVPFSEHDLTDHPSNLYGATKKANELLAYAYHHLYKFSAIGLRFFTVYGPFGRPDMAYFSFTKALLENTKIPLFHDGMMQRDFTYIDDIIQGIISAIHHDATFDIFNLGNNSPHSVEEMISYLEEYTEKKAIKEYLPFQPGEMMITYADITKARKALSFAPKTSFQTGLKKFVAWYLDYYSINRH